jgi:Domain of unknown function (DUF3883)
MAADVIDRIVEQNLGVYRASPSRLQEDVSQEAQVASDYRGRLVYELLQNADDAMADGASVEDRVSFLVTDRGLWIANSGRSLTDEDVQGLCGLGASSKVDAHGIRRASIGHKGLGFKSVLEITSAPAAFSRTCSFELGQEHARRHVDELWRTLGFASPQAVPAMRFPSRLTELPAQWRMFEDDGLNTAFHFPFSPWLRPDKQAAVAEVLLGLPLTTVLFLKHLERVDVSVDKRGRQEERSWRIRRERLHGGGWKVSPGLVETGLYRVMVAADDGESATFLLAHDADVKIGSYRVGLSGPAWDGVELAEVSVAVLAPSAAGEFQDAWRRFHVFLPTAETCPYPLLVNGAFTTDLSRRQLRVSSESGDYNSHLIRQAAHLVRTRLLPVLREAGPEAVLAALDRGVGTGGPAAEFLHESLVDELAAEPILPTELGPVLPFARAVLPAAILGADGEQFRGVLVEDATWQERVFPAARYCSGRWARVAADHGAMELDAAESIGVLAARHDPFRSRLIDDESGGFEIDPLLELCRFLWERASPGLRRAVEVRARAEPLFPVTRAEDRTVERVALGDDAAFYPPRSARHELPLQGLQFMCHSLCWGALLPKERTALLDDRMKAWGALFEIREFRFEQVMQAAVLPALVLHPGRAAAELLGTLQNVKALAAICQLAGAFAKPDRPLRYQRLQSDRALFNLSRLQVPCRGPGGQERWLPAYRVYFGSDWIGDDSAERIAQAVPDSDPAAQMLNFQYLAPPDRFLGTLRDLGVMADPGNEDDDEVGPDEDTDQAIETDERDRWIAFLSWIGVNRALRPVHFHDVEDDATGWLTTRDLAQPQGHAFKQLGRTWQEYRDRLRGWLARRPEAELVVPYLYEVHDLDGILPLLGAAERDASAEVGRRLFDHLARHWTWYSHYTDAQVALIDKGKWPGARAKPQRAQVEELHDAGDNLWLFRLRGRGFCPTTHGPRRPEVAWQPSSEIERRFGRRGRSAEQLMPILKAGSGLSSHSLRMLSERLGIRSELSPSTFGVQDARLMCQQLESLFSSPEGTHVDANQLRTVIKPVYRQMFELLSGRAAADEAGDTLTEVRLLADTSDGPRFLPAAEILYAATQGIRERSGVAGIVPTFILVAESGVTAPITRLFGVRVLEEVLEWHPDPGESPLDTHEVAELRRQLRALMPSILARIRVERTDARDKRVLVDFAERLEPVDELHLTCTLDGSRLDRVQPRPYFVRPPAGEEPLQAFVEWNGPAWPPAPETAQSLAMALADALGMNLVETFLAFIQSDKRQRERLLSIAGASGALAEAEGELADDHPERTTGVSQDPAPTPAPEASTEHAEVPARPSADPAPAAPPIPLLHFEDLTIDGQPLLIGGDIGQGTSGPGPGRPAGRQPAPEHPGLAAAGTDLAALDLLGMRIAMEYEVRRLRRQGLREADILSCDDGPVTGDSLVVDVHSPEAIRSAEAASEVVKNVMAALESGGISRLFPGFDILSIAAGEADRLIELKSSGVDARVQAMSWNEWKSASASASRTIFWLYLVGNLRADLHPRPFIRAIKDPFGSLVSREVEDSRVSRAVQLRVREFTQAEHLDLGIVHEGRAEDVNHF